MNRIRRTAMAFAAAGVVAGSAALAGCAPGASSTASATPEWGDSPLYNYLVPLYGEEDQQLNDQKNREVEALTAACMAKQGFVYTPDDPAPLTTAEQYHPDDPSWVARWGYGIVEYPNAEGQQTFYAPLVNNVYAASLTGSEAGAYYDALYGTENTDAGWATGCYGSSYIDVWGARVDALAQNKPIFDAIDGIDATVRADPAIVQLESDWSDCMAASGYTGFTAQADAQHSIDDTAIALDMTDSQQVDAAHEKEVQVALADLDCRRQTDYKDTYTRIQFALETQFIADHKAELDDVIAQAEAARAAATG